VKFPFFDIVSVAAVLSYFVPLIIVSYKKLWKDNFFLLFAVYWAIGGLVNACDVIPGISRTTCYYIGVFYNIIDIPIILAILYSTTSSSTMRRFIPVIAAAIICAEIAGLVSNGFNFDSLKYSLGAGIVVVLWIVINEIIRYMQEVEHTNTQNARILVYAAVLFEYATFIIIYIFDYFVQTDENQDGYLIYYFSTLGAILIASCGFILHKSYGRKAGHLNS
jgi:hypothetical protein